MNKDISYALYQQVFQAYVNGNLPEITTAINNQFLNIQVEDNTHYIKTQLNILRTWCLYWGIMNEREKAQTKKMQILELQQKSGRLFVHDFHPIHSDSCNYGIGLFWLDRTITGDGLVDILIDQGSTLMG